MSVEEYVQTNISKIVQGRGGSEGCAVPMNIERLNTLGVIQVECGAQFSLALTRDGEVCPLNFLHCSISCLLFG